MMSCEALKQRHACGTRSRLCAAGVSSFASAASRGVREEPSLLLFLWFLCCYLTGQNQLGRHGGVLHGGPKSRGAAEKRIRIALQGASIKGQVLPSVIMCERNRSRCAHQTFQQHLQLEHSSKLALQIPSAAPGRVSPTW